MPTFKVIVLPHQKRNDGTYNVKIRVTQNRVSRFIRTAHYVSLKDISRRKDNGKERIKIKNQAIIDVMDELILSYRKKLLDAGPAVEGWDVDKIVDYITVEHDKKFSLDFIAYSRSYIERLRNRGRLGTARKHQTAINALVRFVGNTLDINQMNVSLIRKFEDFILSEPKQSYNSRDGIVSTEKKKGIPSVVSYMSSIKFLHNLAKSEFNDEENGVINIPLSPFKKYTIPSNMFSGSRVLTVEQIQQIIDFPYDFRKNSLVDFAKDVFLLSFGLMGINTVDLYEIEKTSFHDGIIVYERKKTRTRRMDKAEMKIRVEPEMLPIMAKYEGSLRLFSFSERFTQSKNFNGLVNSGLKKIGQAIGVPDLNFYYARHSMASICANRLGIDIARVDEMLNHSDPKLSLARVYIEKDFRPLWDANRRLLDLFDWSFYAKEKPED